MFDCPHCDRSFPTEKGMTTHISRGHRLALPHQRTMTLRFSEEELMLIKWCCDFLGLNMVQLGKEAIRAYAMQVQRLDKSVNG